MRFYQPIAVPAASFMSRTHRGKPCASLAHRQLDLSALQQPGPCINTGPCGRVVQRVPWKRPPVHAKVAIASLPARVPDGLSWLDHRPDLKKRKWYMGVSEPANKAACHGLTTRFLQLWWGPRMVVKGHVRASCWLYDRSECCGKSHTIQACWSYY